MKGLTVNIYTDGSDCTNGGASSGVKTMILVDENINAPFVVGADEIYLVIVRRNLFRGEYVHLEPRKNNNSIRPDGYVGAMFGGNFAYSSDSRFRTISAYPLPIHDRFESQEMYNALSR